MEITSSPPITPIKQHMSPLETSPSNTYRSPISRRTSSFSSNHDRSPVSARSSRHRFSNGSQYSNDFSPDGGGGGGGGMGNLADELELLDDDEGEDGEITEVADEEGGASTVDGARDSGIDVSYESKRSPSSTGHTRNFSKPFSSPQKPPDSPRPQEREEKLPPELEDLMNSVARMASYAGTSEDPLIPRVVGLLQDLGNQSSLETGVQRMNTSTNSITSYVTVQSKTLQQIATSLYSPLALYGIQLDPVILDELAPLIDALLQDLPLPDPAPLQGLQKLLRETDNTVSTLSQLTDTLQMGKHVTNDASRRLRDSQRMVAELRRERERADAAREELGRGGWNERVQGRWGEKQCGEILGGFERRCEELRRGLVEAGGG
ncbi:uncharacterized protein LTR77_003722 [Saxophila tyrrhenica]|uniref:Uncharacterized protein n=1 Tax=Saxophila tyrrhenica TaxID=1690608 RepID=A0AAV9PEW1_9PEZI|nr:hypothetical protein LTR77_003722 [Saxophila tyrrhenica]